MELKPKFIYVSCLLDVWESKFAIGSKAISSISNIH